MNKHKAEVIDLQWEDGVEEIYIRGHMEPVDAHELLIDYYRGNYDQEYSIKEPHKSYGRWSRETDFYGKKVSTLRTYSEPGRGRFPIMIAKVISYCDID